jgi:BCD family chlorophyll transporter-like MFS transporter
MADALARVPVRFLPFADAASEQLPLGRLLRLALFQVSVGMALVLLNGTLNRVMIVELAVPTTLVAVMVSLPILFAPFRALLGFRSDMHRSFIGWRRVPYIYLGSMLQFGGLAILPFALLVLSGDTHGPIAIGYAGAALAFLLIGAGLHTTQTAGLALASDLAPADRRHRVVALLYVMLLVGMVISAAAFAWVLDNFSQVRLIQVIQGAAVITMVLNTVAIWKQEALDPNRAPDPTLPRPDFRKAWRQFTAGGRSTRLLVGLGLGTAGFSMQDILLEPYGGQVLGLSVAATTMLTALLSIGALAGFAFAARALGRGGDPVRLAALGVLVGLPAFSAVIFSAALQSADLFRVGAVLIGIGGGMFSVGTLTAAMADARRHGDGVDSGLALGAWGAVQATTAGVAIALGGVIRDAVGYAGAAGSLGPALAQPSSGYLFVYHIELGLIFASLVAIGPLVGAQRHESGEARFGLAELPS